MNIIEFQSLFRHEFNFLNITQMWPWLLQARCYFKGQEEETSGKVGTIFFFCIFDYVWISWTLACQYLILNFMPVGSRTTFDWMSEGICVNASVLLYHVLWLVGKIPATFSTSADKAQTNRAFLASVYRGLAPVTRFASNYELCQFGLTRAITMVLVLRHCIGNDSIIMNTVTFDQFPLDWTD